MILLSFFLLVAGGDLLAQRLSDTLKISEITIRSARPLSRTGLTTTLLDSSVLKHRLNLNLSDLMAENSSVFIKSYGRGAMASASFRGTAPSQTIVSWNGLELNSPMLGMVDFSQIPVFFIDEINLVHGNASLSQRPGALGGILDMTTKIDWKERFSGFFSQGLGSYGTVDDYLRINAGNSSFQATTRIFYNHSDNDFRYLNKHVIDSVNFESGKKYHPVAVNRDAGYTNKGLLQQLAWRKSNNETLDMNIWIQDSKRSLPGIQSSEQEENGLTNRQHDRFLRSSLNYQLYHDSWKFSYFNGVNLNQLSYFSAGLSNGTIPEILLQSESDVFSMENKVNFSFRPSPKDEVEGKIRYIIHSVESLEEVYNRGYDRKRQEIINGLNWRRQWNHRVRSYMSIGKQWLNYGQVPFVYTFGGEYHLFPAEKLFLKAGYARNIRVPTLNDLYFRPGGNPDLQPEDSRSAEFSMVSKQEFSHFSLRSSLALYISNVEDWIIWLPGFKGYWEPANIEQVKTRGLELNTDISGQWSKLYYRIRADYAFTHSLNYGNPLNWADKSIGKQLPYIPVHSANLNTYLTFNDYFILYTWNYYSERFTTNSNEKSSLRDYLYPYFMSNLRLGKKFRIRNYSIDLALAVYNLLDEEYRSVLQRPMPGRNYNLMMKVAF